MLSKISNISFKSIPLYDTKIKKIEKDGSYKSVDATFSLLNPNDRGDIKAINKLGISWWRTKYISCIARNFNIKMLRHFSNFYALELKGNEPLDKRIVSLCEVSKSPLDYPNCYIDFLQTSPQISKKRTPMYKGAGEVTMYGVVLEAKKDNTKGITLTSSDSALPFYKHIGFETDGVLNQCYLPDHKFGKYISYIEQKFNF